MSEELEEIKMEDVLEDSNYSKSLDMESTPLRVDAPYGISSTGRPRKRPVGHGGRPPKFNSVSKLEKMIDKYFTECELNKKLPLVTGLAYALGCDRRTLLNYEKEECFKDFILTIKRAKQKIELGYEEQLMAGKAAAGTIFSLLNNYGWEQKTKQDINTKVELSGKLTDTSDEDLDKRIKEIEGRLLPNAVGERTQIS